MADVASDLRNGILHPDQLPVSYFIDSNTGKMVAESNRTLAALSMAGMKPTKLKEIIPSQDVLERLVDPKGFLRHRGEVFGMPGRAIPITPGPNNDKILDIVRLP